VIFVHIYCLLFDFFCSVLFRSDAFARVKHEETTHLLLKSPFLRRLEMNSIGSCQMNKKI
jgi:hypothetical protein